MRRLFVRFLICTTTLSLAQVNVFFDGTRPSTLPSWVKPSPRAEAEWVVRIPPASTTTINTQKRAARTWALVAGIIGAGIGTAVGLGVSDDEHKLGGALLGGAYGLNLLGGYFGLAFGTNADQGYQARELHTMEFASLSSGERFSRTIDVEVSSPVRFNAGVGPLLGAVLPGSGLVVFGYMVLGLGRWNENEGMRRALAAKRWPQMSNAVGTAFVRHFGESDPPVLEIVGDAPKPGAVTADSTLFVVLRASDDVRLQSVDASVNENLVVSRHGLGRELSTSIDIPLVLGDNRITVAASDWMDKSAVERFEVFRRRATESDRPPETPGDIPVLALRVHPEEASGDGVFDGGEPVGIRLELSNNGTAPAVGVKVALSGDEYLRRFLGDRIEVGHIAPGQTVDTLLKANLPPGCPRRVATLYVDVVEGRGFNPMVRPELKIPMAPAGQVVIQAPDPILPTPDCYSEARRSAYAVIVGVGDYRQVTDIPYARKDAEVFARYAQDVLGVPRAKIKILLDEEATGTWVNATIGNIPDGPGRPELLYFYFSGHGGVNPKILDTLPYLLPQDASPELGIDTYLSLREICDKLADRAKQVVVIVDACYVGGGKTIEVAGKPFGRVAQVNSDRVVVLSSSQAMQPSLEYKAAGHSLFSYFLMRGLGGSADAAPYGNGDGWVTLAELASYSSDRVGEASEWRQTPTSNAEGMNAEGLKLGRYR